MERSRDRNAIPEGAHERKRGCPAPRQAGQKHPRQALARHRRRPYHLSSGKTPSGNTARVGDERHIHRLCPSRTMVHRPTCARDSRCQQLCDCVLSTSTGLASGDLPRGVVQQTRIAGQRGVLPRPTGLPKGTVQVGERASQAFGLTHRGVIHES